MKSLNRFTKFIVVILALAVGSISCTDVSEDVYNEITEENFNPTQEDIPALLAPSYTSMRWFLGCCYSYVSMQAGAGDLFLTPGRPNGWGGPYLPYHRHTWTENHPHVTTAWSNIFNGINNTNRILSQIESGLVEPEPDARAALIAEIRALRAFFYWQLMDNFGDVPIVTDFESQELPVQSTRKEVFDFIVQELNESIPDLTEAVGQSTYGRMHKWAALTLLSRVYLNAEVYTGTPMWNQVIETADQVINSGQFQLTADLRDNFVRANDGSPEIVFAIPFDEVFAGGNTMHMRTLAPSQQAQFQMAAQPWGGSSATPQFIDTYDEDDTRLDDTWSGGPQTDPQGNVVIDIVKNVPSIEFAEFNEGFRINKYEIYEGLEVQSNVDHPVFRYSMVLMMKAEALLRTGSPDQAAILVTQVRERAFADSDLSKAPVSGAELQQGSSYNYGFWENGEVSNVQGGDDIVFGRFLDELAWEFAVEGFRRQDLIRFKTAGGTPVFIAKSWFNKNPSQPCRTIFPIPQSAIDDNSNLEQRNNCFD